jgi:hypothetical protein
MKRAILMVLTLFFAILAINFTIIYKNRVSLPYNSMGNYFDESSVTVYNEQSVLVYGILALLFLGISLYTGYFALQTHFKSNNET